MLPQNEKASRRSCLILSILIFVVLPFSLITLLLLLWYSRESSGRSQLNARIASLAKQGYPVDYASVDSFYKGRTNPANTDAWLTVLDTIGSQEFTASTSGVPILGTGDAPPIRRDDEWKEEEVALAFLEKWKSLSADAIRLSIDANPVRYPIVFNSLNSDVDRIQATRNIGRLIQLQGSVALRNRDSAKVRDAISALMGLSRVNAGEPMIISHLVGMAIDGMAIGFLKDAIGCDALSESDLQALLPRVLASTNIGKDWETAIAGERALALPIFKDPSKGRSEGIIALLSNSRDALFYIDQTQSLLEANTEELSDFDGALKAFDTRLRSQTNASWISQWDSIMTMQTTPAISATGGAFVRRAMMHRIAALAIGLRLYEARHSKFPSSLKELSSLPMDIDQLAPSKGYSFGYRSMGRDTKLWGSMTPDVFSISAEPPEVVAGEPANDALTFWLWQFRAKGE